MLTHASLAAMHQALDTPRLAGTSCPLRRAAAAAAAMERSYSPGYTSPSGQRYALKTASEPPSGGLFFGQTCLVTGGGGIVGHALIGRILREGGAVIAPVRTQRSADKLRHMLRDDPTHRLRMIIGDYTTAAGAHTLVSWLNTRAQGGLDHVVSIHGGRHASAKLSDVRGGDFKETMHGKVLPHIIVSQACMPHLLDRPQSSYTIITGRMGEECMKTDEALLTIANAATFGVAAALRAELHDAGVLARANELRIGAVIRRDDAPENPAFPGWRAEPASRLASVIVAEMLGDKTQEVIRVDEADIEAAPEEERREAERAEGVRAAGVRRVGAVVAEPVKLVVPALREGPPAEQRAGAKLRGEEPRFREREPEREPREEHEHGTVAGKVSEMLGRVGIGSGAREA